MKYILSFLFLVTLCTINAQLEFEKELEIINKTWNQKDVFHVEATYKFWNVGNRSIKPFKPCSDGYYGPCFDKDCKCMEVTAPQRSIPPGGEGSFTIIYKVDPSISSHNINVNVLKRGSYHKTVNISLDGEEWYELELKGNVNLTN
jgi:hypothetical protein